MCELCLSSPCRPGCPNAEPPRDSVVYTCSVCEGPILEGERYLDVCGMFICDFCIDAHTYEAWADDEV